MSTQKEKTDEVQDFPLFCDYTCKHSGFADPDAIGACRKDLAVWCSFFKRYNNKHNRCFAQKSNKKSDK